MFKPDPIQTACWRVLNPLMPDGLPLYHANQGDTETGDYASLAVTTRQRQGQDTRVEIDAVGVQMYRGQRGGTITLQIISDDCNAIADTIINSLQMESASGLFRQHGVVMHSANVITFDPIELEGGQYMQLAVIDMQWRAQVQYYDEVGRIEYVVAKYNIKTDGGKDQHGGFAVALDGGDLPDGKVMLVQWGPVPKQLKVGDVIEQPDASFTPRLTPPVSAWGHGNVSFVPDDAVEVTVDASHMHAEWRMLKAGPVDAVFTWINRDGTTVTDTLTLQINP